MAQITVVLPVYNGGEYLHKSVQSVLNQIYTDFEFLICDDGSSDGSIEYLKSLDDSRIKLFFNEKNKGLFPTLNFLLRQAQTGWVHLWSQDDIMYPFCLEEEIKFIEKHPEVPFFFSQRDIIDQNGKIIKSGATEATNELISEEHLVKVSILAGSITGNIANTVVNKKAVEEAGYFDENMKYSADFDMWEKLSRGKPIGVINKPLIQLRSHSGQLSRQYEMKIHQLRENHEIINRFLERIKDPVIKKKAQKGIKWKIQVMHFAFGLQILRHNRQAAKEYFLQLKKQTSLAGVAIRYVIVKVVDILGLKAKFYHILFYKNYYKSN